MYNQQGANVINLRLDPWDEIHRTLKSFKHFHVSFADFETIWVKAFERADISSFRVLGYVTKCLEEGDSYPSLAAILKGCKPEAANLPPLEKRSLDNFPTPEIVDLHRYYSGPPFFTHDKQGRLLHRARYFGQSQRFSRYFEGREYEFFYFENCP